MHSHVLKYPSSVCVILKNQKIKNNNKCPECNDFNAGPLVFWIWDFIVKSKNQQKPKKEVYSQ
jgi:hypothetical protein